MFKFFIHFSFSLIFLFAKSVICCNTKKSLFISDYTVFNNSIVAYFFHHMSDIYLDFSGVRSLCWHVNFLCRFLRSLCLLVWKKERQSPKLVAMPLTAIYTWQLSSWHNFPTNRHNPVFHMASRVTLYIYHMASRVTYQNISLEVTRKPWRVTSPDAFCLRHRVTQRARAFVSPRGW